MDVAEFEELVGVAIGEASVCWDKDNVFMSEKASVIVDRIVKAAVRLSLDRGNRKEELEMQISGHINTLRPLLDEWASL